MLRVAGSKLPVHLQFSLLVHNVLWGMLSYVATWGFLCSAGHCFIQTVGDLAISVCFVMVGHANQLALTTESWCQACSLGDLSFVLRRAWMEWVWLWRGCIISAPHVRWTVRVCFMGGEPGRMTQWRVVECEGSERSLGGLWFCIRGCRQLLHYQGVSPFPPRHSVKAWGDSQLSD